MAGILPIIPSLAGATPQCQTLVVDEVEGEAGADWGQGRGPGTVRHVLDGRGGYSATTVQDHPWPYFMAGPSVTRADISETVLVEMKIAQDLVVGSVQIRTSSTDGGLRWLPLGGERPQEGP